MTGTDGVAITFVGHDGARHQVHAVVGATLMETAVAQGVPGIIGECGGQCICSTCQIWVEPADQPRLAPRRADEIDTLAEYHKLTDHARLGCQIVVTAALDGLVVRTPLSQY